MNLVAVLRGRFNSMHNRCYNQKCKSFRCYGGRGIAVDDRWHNFDLFVLDLLPDFLKKTSLWGVANTTLERINNDGNYAKSNCKWVTMREQAKNKRFKVSKFYQLIPKKVKILCEKDKKLRSFVLTRARRGLPINLASLTKIKNRKRFYLHGKHLSLKNILAIIPVCSYKRMLKRLHQKHYPIEKAFYFHPEAKHIELK